MEYSVKVDPVITTTSDTKFVIEKGASLVTVNNYISDSFSDSQIQFTVTAQNNRTFLSRKMYVMMTARATLTAANPGVAIFPSGDLSGVCGLRFLPLHNTSTTISLQINNTSTTINARNYLDALCRYGFSKETRDRYMSIEPAVQDLSQTYDDTYNTNYNPIDSTPFNNTASCPRGVYGRIVSDDGTTAVVDFYWSELVTLVSPLAYQNHDRYGLVGLTNFILTFNLGDISRMVSYDNVNGTPLSSISVTIPQGSPPILNVRWLRPPFSVDPAGKYLYPYSQIQHSETAVGIIPANTAVGEIQSANYQLPAIPSRMYIFARAQNNTQTAFSTDSYLYIENLSVEFCNQTGVFSNYSPIMLYNQLMVKNGWQHSFPITSQHLGSVLCIDFGEDFPLPPSKAPGVQGQEQIQITVRLRNLSSSNINAALYIVPVYDGLFVVDNGSTSILTNILRDSDAEMADLYAASKAQPSDVDIFMLEGGSLNDVLGGLKKFASKAGDLAHKGMDWYGRNREAIHAAVRLARDLGLGALELAPLILGAGLDVNDIEPILSGAGYSSLELQHLRNTLGGCMGGALVSNPEKLLSGGSLKYPTSKSKSRISKSSLLNRY